MSKGYELSEISCSGQSLVASGNSTAFDSGGGDVFDPFVAGGLECRAERFDETDDSGGGPGIGEQAGV